MKKYSLLRSLNSLETLRSLPKEQLVPFCQELRDYLLESVSTNSGHFASGLGVVELTVALHYIYNTPFDNIVWDIGHQAYVHKIITGRRDTINTIRKRGGLHPFLCREESEYDVLTAGHSSTSISAALGLAIAASKENKNRRTVCVIGDGAMTAGMAFEALNHGGYIKSTNILVILNDNQMSISENVGALKEHLSSLKTDFRINHQKDLIKSTLFDLLGWQYIGPYDGHNLLDLIEILKSVRNLSGPYLLHVFTKKGKGYTPAEENPTKWHAVNKFDLNKNELVVEESASKKEKINYSNTFGLWLNETAKKDQKLIAITPAMGEGSGMSSFAKKYPDQYCDVGIAEQHAVTLSTGLAIGGLRPVVAVYSTFLQRCYDQIIHDIAIPKLPVLFAIDRAGIVGFDGQTHQGAFDISFLRCIPNTVIMTPSDENELINMLHTGYNYKKGPCIVRYPRGSSNLVNKLTTTLLSLLPIGKSLTRRLGKKIAILNFGHLLSQAIKVAENLNATLVDMRFVKPLDKEYILKLTTNHEILVTLEEAAIFGGAGSAVNELLLRNKIFIPILNIGLPDQFIPHGSQEEIRKCYGLDAFGIQQTIINWLNFKNK
ncbi:MAG: 1-deoxy-D-xylulose-5-phosphate synthase [Candidatus Dasytiphilus stammeri]